MPKQWVKFMRNGENKTDLVKFLLKDWSHKIRFLHLLNGKKVFLKFYALEVVDGKVSCLDIEELATDQEEADTKVFLCCFHASSHGFSSVCILTVDSDIPIYALYFEDKIDVHIFVKNFLFLFLFKKEKC